MILDHKCQLPNNSLLVLTEKQVSLTEAYITCDNSEKLIIKATYLSNKIPPMFLGIIHLVCTQNFLKN